MDKATSPSDPIIEGHIRLQFWPDFIGAAFAGRNPVRSALAFAAFVVVMPPVLVAMLDHEPVNVPAWTASLGTNVPIAVASGAMIAIIIPFVAATISYLRMSPGQREIRTNFDANGVTLTDGAGTAARLPWSAVRRVRETRRAFIILLRPAGCRYVPKSAFAEADITRIRQLHSSRK